jgi:drug/metabolite transporter (DMT)-like permease
VSQSVAVPVPSSSRGRWLIWASLISVYLIWGSTYLAIRFVVHDVPPFMGMAARFIVAGAILYGILRATGAANPSARQVWNAARVGVFLMVGGMGLVSFAESIGVGSGLAATVIAVTPLFVAGWSTLWGLRPSVLELVGMLLGLVGVVLLSLEGDFQAKPLGLALVVCAPLCWSFGSVWSRHLSMPAGPMATACEMFFGGLALGLVSLLTREHLSAVPGTQAILAWVYLVTFGSLIAFTAYIFLLEHTRPAVATSYAYVNPVVAVILGVLIGGEHVTGWAYLALPVILAGVGVVMYGQNRART